MKSKDLHKYAYVAFVFAGGIMYGDYIAPLVGAEYGDRARTVAIVLYALYTVGCVYIGRCSCKYRKTGDKQE